VLKEAASAIRTEGAAGIGVAAVMARAGLTQGGFYAHFKSKDDLVAQAISTMFQERYAAFWVHPETADPRIALATFIDRYLSPRHRDAPEHGCPIPTLSGELPRLSADARSRFEEGVERLIGAAAVLVEHLHGDTPESARQSAASMIAEMAGAMSIARACRDSALSAEVLAASRMEIRRRMNLQDVE